jgi:ABC-type sugar transport system ATPase subunit
VRGWLTPKPDPEFDTKCADVCAVYNQATAAAAQDIRTVSVDEMTGVQALERAAPDLPMRPADPARREFEYVRHGTQTLIAAFDVATGQVLGVVGDTRTEQDYASFLKTLFETGAPTTTWYVVADNLNTHVSESVVRLVADLCGIEDDLGEKGKSGMLASRVAREAFLRGATHRVQFHFTPKHAS